MDKPKGIDISEITVAQQKNELKFSSFIQKQVDKLNSEKLLADSKNVKVVQDESPAFSKDNEAIRKSLVDKTGDGLNSNIMKMAKDIKNVAKLQKEQVKGILEKSREQKEFKSVGQRVQGVKEGFKDLFTVRGFLDKTGIAKRGSGGFVSNMLDAKEAAETKAKARIATGERARDPETGRNMGADASEKKFLEDAKKEQALRRKQGDLERAIQKKYKSAGLTEEQISTTPEAKELKKVAKELVPLDPRGMEKYTEKPTSSDDKEKRVKVRADEKEAKKALSGADEEYQIEQSRLVNEQNDLLVKIEENTRPGAAGQAEPKEAGEGGGGILSGIGKGLGALGAGLGKLGAGIGKGIVGIFIGLAKGITILGTAVMSGVGAVGLAALAGIILTIAGALRLAAPAIEAFAPVLMKLAEQIGIVAGVIGEVFIEAIKQLPEVISSIAGGIVDIIGAISDGITSTIDAVTSSIERLSAIDGMNLLQVGAGLTAVAAGMAAFAASNVVAGISQVAGKLMSVVSGTKTPVEQLEQIAGFGPNLNQAGTGVKNLAKGLAEFGNIDAEKIEAISKLPLEKIVAASNASRATQAVDKTSSDNKMKALPVTAQPSTNVVSAPTTITKQTKNIMLKQSIRNPEGSVNQYIRSRFAC